MSVVIRDAEASDLPAILAIYNEAILHTTATYDVDPVTLENRRAWLEGRRALGHAVLVAEVDGRVLGFGSWGTFRAKTGYDRTMEHSVYVDAEARGQGLGRALMQAIIDTASAARVHALIGGLDADNEVSVALHEAFGFVEVGRLPQVAAKFGRWLDLLLVQLTLDAAPTP